MVCQRAGMYSFVHPDADDRRNLLHELDEDAKVRLCAEIAYQNVVYNTAPLMDAGLIRGAKARSMPTVPERLDLALEWLVRRSPTIGSRPLSNQGEGSFIAFSYCRPGGQSAHPALGIGSAEADAILMFLEQQGLVEFPSGHEERLRLLMVSHLGYARYEELRKKSVDSSRAFVAMWFGKEMDAVYNGAIRPAIEDAGYEPDLVKNVQHNRKIDDEIIALIRRSRFVVADFTAGKPEEPRGGVYYEAGFAYGLGREVIFTCRRDFVEALHFDTRQYNHIVWEEAKLPDFREELRHRIEATIGPGPKTGGAGE